MTEKSAGKRLKELMGKGIALLPGVFNGITARLVEETGFRALYISGAGLANGTAALPDTGLLTMTEVLNLAGYITRAVKIPCLVDGDTGFGEISEVKKMIIGMESIGAAGVHIEDQILPKKCGHLPGKELIPPAKMAEKVAAAVEARKDPDFLIIARTDARAVEGMEGAVKRAHLYLKAGADVIFPEALKSREEFLQFAGEVKSPLLANMTEFGESPYITVKEFEEMGYRMVIFPMTAMRFMLKGLRDALEILREEGTQKSLLGEMFTRKEVYHLIGYEPPMK